MDIEIDISDLSIMACVDCKNYFFIHEIPMALNDPKYCPYCGIAFEEVEEV